MGGGFDAMAEGLTSAPPATPNPAVLTATAATPSADAFSFAAPAAAADTFSSPVLISSPALVLPTPTPSRAPMPPPEDDSDDEFGFGPSPTSRGLGGGFGGGLSGAGLGGGLGVGLSDAPVMVLNSDLDAPQLISERELALSDVSSAVSATLASSEFSEVGSSEWNSPNPLHASAHHDAPLPTGWLVGMELGLIHRIGRPATREPALIRWHGRTRRVA
jgi:hypothetical protein